MRIFSSRKTEEVSTQVAERPPNKVAKYTAHDVHRDFESATEAVLNTEMSDDLKERIKKMKRLGNLGFYRSKGRKTLTSQEIDLSNELDKVTAFAEYYAQHYPSYKFITEKSIERLCEKYGLVMGETSLYLGDVPNKNLDEMERFSLRQEDDDRYRKTYICAPPEDMDMGKVARLINGYKIVVEDPIVLREVSGGYLIITKWGPEASDELVVNEKMN